MDALATPEEAPPRTARTARTTVGAAAAVIADIVGSRRLPDRAGAQTAIIDTLVRAGDGLDVRRAPWATVGDEFQVVLGTCEDAVVYTARVHVLLPPGLGLRFGIGWGDARALPATAHDGAALEDGSAWWSAREAIERAHELQDAGDPSARTWLAASADDPSTAATNALLLVRDHVIARMKARERRIAAGLLMGRTQLDLAAEEGVGQSAVSQSAHRSGAAELLQVQRLLLDSRADAGAPTRAPDPSSGEPPR